MATTNDELRQAREAAGLDPDQGGASISERAASNGQIEETDQQGLFDREVEHDSLERALVARAKRADEKRVAANNYKNADERAKALIEELDLQVDEVVRVGRFKIKLGRVSGGTPVSFTTGEREQLYISEIKDS